MASLATFSLFKKTDMEGFLEKVSSGIASKLKGGKTKVWCELCDTTLHIFKESKRSSTGVQEIDMKQVHMVRKASTDKAGNQFEILCRSKSQTFVAPTAEECNSWIRQLQRSMTLKGEDKQRASTGIRKMSLGDYETIMVSSENTAASPQLNSRESNVSEPGYAEVEFHNAPASPKTPVLNTDKSAENAVQAEGRENTATEQEETQPEEEGGYSVVEVVRRNAVPVGQPVLQEVKDARRSANTSSDPPALVPNRNTDEYGYSTVEVNANVAAECTQTQPELPAVPLRTEAEGSVEDSYGYATVNRQPSIPAAEPSEEVPRSAGDGASDDASDDDDIYVHLTTSSPDPIPKFPHPLEATDTQPLAVLQEFLSNNRKVCRRSFLDKTPAEDPVGDMKKMLLELQL
ncbi:uncharacterized protein [Littorina saxatilis]|uniref:PH domain-containing protein n=1 Tax=Littorina saxatilis TaxID=31220 RepID=A0AAN9BU83_9CAEN